MSLANSSHVFSESRLQRHHIKINSTDDPFIQLRCEWSAQLTLIHHSPLAIKTRAPSGLVLHGIYAELGSAKEITRDHVIFTNRPHKPKIQTSTCSILIFPYLGELIQHAQPAGGRWKKLNCNRRTPKRTHPARNSLINFHEGSVRCRNAWWVERQRHRLWSLLKQLLQTNEGHCWSIFGTLIRTAGLISLITVNWWHSETIQSIKQTKLGSDDVCFPLAREWCAHVSHFLFKHLTSQRETYKRNGPV